MPEYFYCDICENENLIIVRADSSGGGLWCNGCGSAIPKDRLPKANQALLNFVESWSNLVHENKLSSMLPHSLREDLTKMMSNYYHCKILTIDQRKE